MAKKTSAKKCTAPKTPRKAAVKPASAKPAGSKQATIIEMLRSEDGATIADIVGATGWQPHTVRGAISGALKKRLGLDITSEKIADRGRVYRIDR